MIIICYMKQTETRVVGNKRRVLSLILIVPPNITCLGASVNVFFALQTMQEGIRSVKFALKWRISHSVKNATVDLPRLGLGP